MEQAKIQRICHSKFHLFKESTFFLDSPTYKKMAKTRKQAKDFRNTIEVYKSKIWQNTVIIGTALGHIRALPCEGIPL